MPLALPQMRAAFPSPVLMVAKKVMVLISRNPMPS